MKSELGVVLIVSAAAGAESDLHGRELAGDEPVRADRPGGPAEPRAARPLEPDPRAHEGDPRFDDSRTGRDVAGRTMHASRATPTPDDQWSVQLFVPVEPGRRNRRTIDGFALAAGAV